MTKRREYSPLWVLNLLFYPERKQIVTLSSLFHIHTIISILSEFEPAVNSDWPLYQWRYLSKAFNENLVSTETVILQEKRSNYSEWKTKFEQLFNLLILDITYNMLLYNIKEWSQFSFSFTVVRAFLNTGTYRGFKHHEGIYSDSL